MKAALRIYCEIDLELEGDDRDNIIKDLNRDAQIMLDHLKSTHYNESEIIRTAETARVFMRVPATEEELIKARERLERMRKNDS